MTTSSLLKIAIIGRPNVGKSTLFNRLTGKDHALIDDQPGVTRDRREGSGFLAGMQFRLIDTAGLENAKSGTLQDRMRAQTEIAIEQADMILLMLDGRAGLMPDDHYFARQIRKSHVPIIVLVNKCEGKAGQDTLAEAWQLGLDTPIPVSAAHGEGLAHLFEAIIGIARPLGLEPVLFAEEAAPLPPPEAIIDAEIDDETAPDIWIDADTWIDESDKTPMRIAIVGRPNMGKSTLVNQLLGEARVLTGPESGITRDSITLDFTWEDKPYQLVDTAGIRRQAKITDRLEKRMVRDAARAIEFAKICVLLLDARQPPHKQDITLARRIADEGRALVIAANMWDDVSNKQQSWQQINDRLETSLAQLRGVPIVPISALYGQGLDRLMTACDEIYKIWTKRISTARLNRWLEPMLEAHPPPLTKGRRLRIRYITQIRTRPPTFALFASRPSDLPTSYLRYLITGLRQDFGLAGIPIRMIPRKNTNPYAPKTR